MNCVRLRALAALALIAAQAAPVQAEELALEALDVSSASVRECQAEHERAKLLEVEERWLEARESMRRCSTPSCPLALRADCSAWLEALARAWPTLLVVVERDDATNEPMTFELDGRRVELVEPPTPIEVLPGQHRLSFSLGARPRIEREIEVAMGEKNRVVRVRFPALVSARPPERPPLPLAPATSRPVPTSSYVLGASALAAFGVSTALLVSALSSLDDARARCSPGCSSDVRESIDRRLLFADLTAGLGLVLTGAAAYTFVTRPFVSVGRAPEDAHGAWPRAGLDLTIRGSF